MFRPALLAFTCVMAVPATAEPARSVVGVQSAPLIDPVTLKVNEAAARRMDAASKARDVAWDAKIHRTMSGVCRGC